jgi:hypothetical protein
MAQQSFLSFEQIQTARRYAARAEELAKEHNRFTLYPALGGAAVHFFSSYANLYDTYVTERTLDAIADLPAKGVVYRELVPDTNYDFPSVRRFVTVTERDGVPTQEGLQLDRARIELIDEIS